MFNAVNKRLFFTECHSWLWYHLLVDQLDHLKYLPHMTLSIWAIIFDHLLALFILGFWYWTYSSLAVMWPQFIRPLQLNIQKVKILKTWQSILIHEGGSFILCFHFQNIKIKTNTKFVTNRLPPFVKVNYFCDANRKSFLFNRLQNWKLTVVWQLKLIDVNQLQQNTWVWLLQCFRTGDQGRARMTNLKSQDDRKM